MPICLISAMAACADGYTAPSRLTDAATGTAARSSGLPARSTSTSRSTRDGSSCAQVMAMAAPLDWPMTANDGAPTASAMASTSRAWWRQPYVPAPVTSLRPRPRRSIATSCNVSPASRSARRSKPHRFADRPGTHTTAGASAAPHRRTRSLPDWSGMSESSYPAVCCVMSALSSASAQPRIARR